MCIDFYADVHPDSVNDGADVDAGVDYIAGAAGEGGRNTENSKAFQGSEPEIDWSVTYVCGFNPFYKLEYFNHVRTWHRLACDVHGISRSTPVLAA